MPLRRIRPEDKTQDWQPRKSVRLYLDDVDEILGVMRQIDETVRVSAGDFVGTIAKAEELTEAGAGNLKKLELEAGPDDPAIGVRLSRPVTVRITRRDDYQLAGAGQAIHDLLSRRQTRTGGWGGNFSLRSPLAEVLNNFFVAGLVGIGALVISALFSPDRDVTGVPVAQVFGAFLAVSVLAASAVTGKMLFGTNAAPSATIVLAYRADAPTWWERNRTTVLISLTTNVVVAGVFFLLGLSLE